MKDVDEKGDDVVETEKGKEVLELTLDARLGGGEEGSNNSSYHAYPRPLACYQDVFSNKNLFMETLEKLHSVMKTKFMIPIIGGKELDLHRLFVEVTSRGGFDKVVGEKRWREVTNVFNFPSTATNASFVLRKYYISLLHHYEQIYFFEVKGWSSLPNALCTPIQCKNMAEHALPYAESYAAAKRRKSSGDAASIGATLPMNQSVVGVIDGKFEDGYFVTVTVGSTTFKGVLFHAMESSVIRGLPVFSGAPGRGSSRLIRHRRRRKKLSSWIRRIQNQTRSGYNFFFAEQHARLKLLHPGKVREISKTIGDLWNNLTEAERAVYQERGLKDKQRYQTEMAVYKERRAGMIISNAMPIQQRPLGLGIGNVSGHTKMEVEEGGSPFSNHEESGSEDGTDIDEEKSDEESELQTSTEAGEAAVQSSNIELHLSGEGEAFKMHSTKEAGTGDEQEIPVSGELELPVMAVETSTSKQKIEDA
ncbi:hypothetical protein HPP92_007985 [Vanilla planifolia]|uniref:Uncharacterized protein n=1 Tax=Vanilla planifolia TaxID=51239 RepID=A0A835VA44_VANPL|nr:hypothetical protein HPP92_007985 [Vanilla planifolia]